MVCLAFKFHTYCTFTKTYRKESSMSLENFGNFLTLDEKHSFIKKYFKEFYTKDFKLFASKDKHYRT
ncbi:tRNA (uridine(54)-C5)-methyltransferase TrmA, partial [Campylobacter jejuni]|nr:tRNA (uridine(54)-C5)-methyltransferase TrmA [Campylobacter jejuni]